MVRLSATEVARRFSSIVSRVGAGEEIEIVRNGMPIAELRPARSKQAISADSWREMVETAPPIDEDFAREVAQSRDEIGPPDAAWPS